LVSRLTNFALSAACYSSQYLWKSQEQADQKEPQATQCFQRTCFCHEARSIITQNQASYFLGAAATGLSHAIQNKPYTIPFAQMKMNQMDRIEIVVGIGCIQGWQHAFRNYLAQKVTISV